MKLNEIQGSFRASRKKTQKQSKTKPRESPLNLRRIFKSKSRQGNTKEPKENTVEFHRESQVGCKKSPTKFYNNPKSITYQWEGGLKLQATDDYGTVHLDDASTWRQIKRKDAIHHGFHKSGKHGGAPTLLLSQDSRSPCKARERCGKASLSSTFSGCLGDETSRPRACLHAISIHHASQWFPPKTRMKSCCHCCDTTLLGSCLPHCNTYSIRTSLCSNKHGRQGRHQDLVETAQCAPQARKNPKWLVDQRCS